MRKMKRYTKIGFWLTGVWLAIVIIGVGVIWNIGSHGVMSLNEWGDFLAGVSAPLALFWLVVGYFQQGEELRLNTEALKAQQEELRRQVQETATLGKEFGNTSKSCRANGADDKDRTEKRRKSQIQRGTADIYLWWR